MFLLFLILKHYQNNYNDMNTRSFIYIFTVLLATCMFNVPDAVCEMFKYKDDKGVWHFTDTPSTEVVKTAEKIGSTGDYVPSGSDLSSVLNKKIQPKNDIEKAVMATVTVKTPMGTGSGFFISKKGYIITNRHVLYGDEKMIESMKKRYENGEAMLEEYSTRLDQDKKNIEAAKNELENTRIKIEAIPDQKQRAAPMERYNAEIARIESYEREYDMRQEEYERVKSEFSSEHSELSWSSASSGVAKTCDITLADGSMMTAEIVSVSTDHDLALLRISGVKNVPVLLPVSPISLGQSAKVYAIGTPVNLVNSVTDGIISGFEGNYVKTSAKIYPGNSGGPLVNEKGNVVGINTMKQITHKFEGLGFAIKIDVAMNEFGDIISR